MDDKDTNVPNKNDFISREAALELIDNAPIIAGNENETLISAPKLSDKFYCLPAANVRPVVLCRDCVYYNTTGCADGFGWCEGVMVSKGTSDDFFCAEGKQKPYECGADMREG